MKINQKWLLKSRPAGLFKESDFEWREEPVAALNDGDVLVRQVLLSLDPTNKVWATQDSYLPAVPLRRCDARLRNRCRGGIARRIVHTRRYRAGDVQWQLYAISNGAGLTRLPKGVPLTAFMGVLGHIGMTAYFGLLDIGKPKGGRDAGGIGSRGSGRVAGGADRQDQGMPRGGSRGQRRQVPLD